MRLPRLFCPRCRAFRKWREATYEGEYKAGSCKKCGTRCVFTADYFAGFIIEKVLERGTRNDEKDETGADRR